MFWICFLRVSPLFQNDRKKNLWETPLSKQKQEKWSLETEEKSDESTLGYPSHIRLNPNSENGWKWIRTCVCVCEYVARVCVCEYVVFICVSLCVLRVHLCVFSSLCHVFLFLGIYMCPGTCAYVGVCLHPHICDTHTSDRRLFQTIMNYACK